MTSYIWKNLANCQYQRKVIMHSLWFNCGFLSFVSFFVISRGRVLPVSHLSPKLLLLIRYVPGIFPGRLTPDHKVALMWGTLHMSGHQDHLVRHRRKLPNSTLSSFRQTLLEVPLLSTFQSNYLPPLRGQPNDSSGFSSSSHTFLFSAQRTYLYHMCKHIRTGVHMHTHMSLYI